MTSKRLKILIVILMVFSSSLLKAQDTNTQLWEKANAAYLAQNYQEALNDYLQILRTGNASANFISTSGMPITKPVILTMPFCISKGLNYWRQTMTTSISISSL